MRSLMFLSILFLVLRSVIPQACSDGSIRCPPSTPSAGICVPSDTFCGRALYLNPFAPTPARVSDLLPRLTLEEKVNLMQTQPIIDSAVPSLRVLATSAGECLHGYVSRTPSTLFPQSISLAASFSPAMVRRVAAAIGTEARAWRNNYTAQGNDTALPPPPLTCFAPQINIVRDPRWGRGQETYGEMPELTAVLAAAYVSGLQFGETGSASDPYMLAAATTKHFIGYQGASSRGTFSPTEIFLSWRDQIDTYEVSWRAVLRASTAAVMCAYSSLCHDETNTTCSLPPPAGYGHSHGVPMCADGEMLNGFLRNASRSGTVWDGVVTGDCGAFQFVQTDHLWAVDQAHAAADVLSAGGDFDCSISVGNGFAALVNATALGLVAEADIDKALSRIFTLEMRLGYFDDDYLCPYNSIPIDVVNSPAHRALAAEAARESVVLLRNAYGVLPLSAPALGAAAALLVTGPNAQLFATGNYNTETDLNVTALDGIRAVLPSAAFEPGCASVSSNDTSMFAAAVHAASSARVVIAVMGIDGTQEYEDSTRASLALPGVQDDFLRELISTGVPVVLILLGGSAMAPAPDVLAGVKAVIWAGYGGEEAGTALADVLFGVYNPGGRLPITFYQSADQLPPYLNQSMTGLPFGRTLRYFSGPAPIYRFGEGISYSTFELTSPVLTATSLTICQPLSVSLNVSNTGGLDGDTVVQVYTRLRDVPGSRTTPLLSMPAFERVSLASGEAAALNFTLPPRVFAVVDDETRTWVSYPVTVDIFVGEQSPTPEDWTGAITLEITGAAVPLDACGVPY